MKITFEKFEILSNIIIIQHNTGLIDAEALLAIISKLDIQQYRFPIIESSRFISNKHRVRRCMKTSAITFIYNTDSITLSHNYHMRSLNNGSP